MRIQNPAKSQKDVKQNELDIIKFIKQKRYADAFEKLTALRILVLKHPPLLASLAEFYPINSTFSLSSIDQELERNLIEKLKTVTVSIKDPQEYEITTPILPTFTVYVSDKEGPIPNFPIYVMQNNKTLGELYERGSKYLFL